MKPLSDVYIDISVVVGTTTMPIHQLLRMGRGAVIALDSSENDNVAILANDVQIATGTVILQDEQISVEVHSMRTRNDNMT